MRPGFGPAAELPSSSPVRWRHGGCSSPLGSSNVIGGNRRAASASARGPGRAAYTKDVARTRAQRRPGFSLREKRRLWRRSRSLKRQAGCSSSPPASHRSVARAVRAGRFIVGSRTALNSRSMVRAGRSGRHAPRVWSLYGARTARKTRLVRCSRTTSRRSCRAAVPLPALKRLGRTVPERRHAACRSLPQKNFFSRGKQRAAPAAASL